MSTGRPNPYITGSSSYGVAWRGFPSKQWTGSSSMPSQAHKIPRHGIVAGLMFSAICYWEASRRKESEQLERDLPYLAPGNAPLEPGAAPPAKSPLGSTAADDSTSSPKHVTHATMPLYPLGHNPGGDGPHDDPDLSHLGMQVDWGNKASKTVVITDLEKIEKHSLEPKGYSWDKLSHYGSVVKPHSLNEPRTHAYRMSRNPCAELYHDMVECEGKFGWRAFHGDRISMHDHQLVCTPEKRKFFRCREAARDRKNRLYRLRMRQARGEQVGLASDPAAGEIREFDLQTRDQNGDSEDNYKRLYGYPLEPIEKVPADFEGGHGHH